MNRPTPASRTPPSPATTPPWRRLRWAIGTAAALLVTVGAAACSSERPKEQAAFTSPPAMCGAVSQATLDRLVPKAKLPPTSGTYPRRRYTYCGWNSPTNAKRDGERGVMVAVRLSANDAAAKADFETAWQGALQTQGTTSPGTLHSDAATRINGIGDQAFFTHRTATSGLSTLGTAEETVRVRNAVVTVSYRGRDSNADGPSKANQKRTPLNATTGRLSTDTLAHEVIATLTSCTPCRPRP